MTVLGFHSAKYKKGMENLSFRSVNIILVYIGYILVLLVYYSRLKEMRVF